MQEAPAGEAVAGVDSWDRVAADTGEGVQEFDVDGEPHAGECAGGAFEEGESGGEAEPREGRADGDGASLSGGVVHSAVG